MTHTLTKKERSKMDHESTNSDPDTDLRCHYDSVAGSLALVANGLCHSHRQGVVLCDYPNIAVYDSNGGFPNREVFWAALKGAFRTQGFAIKGEGGYRLDEHDETPYTRALVIGYECVPDPRVEIITQADLVSAAHRIREIVVSLKHEHEIYDGHDVVLFVPADRRQDMIEEAVRDAIRRGTLHGSPAR